MTAPLPKELAPLLAEREDLRRGVLALSAPESLTDPLALDLLRIALGERPWLETFVRALHLCDFVVERNSEWHFAPHIRDALVEQLIEAPELGRFVHRRLLELAEASAPGTDGVSELPRYLHAGVGRTYHATFLSPEAARGYGQLAHRPLSGQEWLAGRLASEQVRLGLIPPDAVEVLFLQGMILYHEKRTSEAEPLLRRVAASPERRHEVAVAAHLVGRLDARRKKRGAEALLRKSLEIGSELGERVHVGQVLHTLGQLVGRDSGRKDEAEQLLRESLEIRWALGERFGVAQVLHTLGQLVGRDSGRKDEAEQLLRESLEIGSELGERFHVAQVLHTLGQLVGRDSGRKDEAEQLLRESLEIGERLNRLNHQAQVLYSLSRVAGVDPDSARELLEASLELNRRIQNRQGQRIVESAIQRLERRQEE
jgi:tetratricopeptide (TPR) repeat protein